MSSSIILNILFKSIEILKVWEGGMSFHGALMELF